jgi:N-acetylmuramoyl-L-alanine amidase
MKRVNLILRMVVVFLLLISSRSFSRDRVCIDPGHGGTDPGCIGRIYGVQEKDVNFGVGLQLYHYFGLANWEPMMTRYADINKSTA